ncbi:MAG: hypothetical protein ACLFRD_07610, partial [Nitriliruptoraceae bacterium]
MSVFALWASGVITPAPAVASTHPQVRSELVTAATRLAETSMVAELTETIPGFGTNPGLLLGLHEAFGALAGISELGDIEGLTAGGFSFENLQLDDGATSGSFDLSADRSVEAPIMLVEDDVQLLGEEVPVTVSMPATTISFEYDGSLGGGESFALVDLPTLTLELEVNETVALPVQFGFADATASGDISLQTAVAVTPADPDGDGRLTSDELDTLAIEDLVELDFPTADDGTDDLDIDLDLTADIYGEEFGGTVTVNDEDLFGDPPAEIDFTADGGNPIDLLTNVGPDLAITALSQYVSGFGLAMMGGDVDLPMLDDGIFIPGDLGDLEEADFDQVFDAIQPLMDYVEPRSIGQIVCGTTATAPEDGEDDGIPAGSVRHLEAGDTVHCRAYTSDDADAVTWSFGNASDLDGDEDTETIGVEPTRNVTATMDEDGKLDVSLEFTPEDGDEPLTVLPRPDTIQEFLAELADAELIPTTTDDVPEFDYDPDLEAFTFPISTVVEDIQRDATANAGNNLVAETGLTGLGASGEGDLDLDFGPIEAAMTLGLIITDDVADINPDDPGDDDEDEPGPGDRFFVRSQEGPVLSVEEVTLDGSLGLEGRLGFLEVEANGEASLNRPDDEPALQVELTTPSSVTVGDHTDDDAILLRELLRQGAADAIDAAVNLAFDSTLTVASSAAGMDVSGEVDVDWDLSTGTRTITADTDFEDELAPFDRADELAYLDDGGDDATLFTTTSGAQLLDMPGLVGSYLVADDGERCQITTVVSDTSLRCTDQRTDEQLEFVPGESYTVRGNTLSHLTEILAALEELAGYLETVVDDEAMAQSLPVVGITPGQLVGQIGELRRMVDEFRGGQAAQIDCEVQGDDTDVRAIELADANVDVIAYACL